jgi:ribosomal protein L31
MKCQECGKDFTPLFCNQSRGFGKFCSKVCYTTYHGKAMRSGEHKCPKPKKVYKFICKTCGREFERDGHTAHRNKYCSVECMNKRFSGKDHPRYNKQPVNCSFCGKELNRSPCYTRNKWGNFCSLECKGKWMAENVKGESHPQWQGGISFEPYCPLFNDSFKERVRAFFDNRCVLCGAEEDACVEKLHVHHVQYNKSACCDESPKRFVALCRSCHTKTNHNRDEYAEMFLNLITTKYQGRSYFTVEEWAKLNGMS